MLDDVRSEQLFHVEAAECGLLPVLFSLTNGGTESLELARDDFRLRVDGGARYAPALPGRAAALLRDDGGSLGAAWTGYLILGFLAAPAIDAAEDREDAAVRSSRETIFAKGRVEPGNTMFGYLFFEAPLPPDELRHLVLEVRPISTAAATELQVVNPYRPD